MKRLIKKFLRAVLGKIYFYCIPPKNDQILLPEKAEEILNNHAPDPCTSCLSKNTVNEKCYDLSIIVPVFNAEQYLNECLVSILNQKTGYSFEVIVVNDGSTDHSASILDGFSQMKNITILHQENRGLSGARNSALQLVRGKHIMFVDSDDYLPQNAVASLMDAVVRWDADIVQGGYYGVNQAGERYLNLKKYDDRESVSPNGVLEGMAWGKVYKSELFQNVCFPERYWFEDTITTSILTHLASKICTISDMVYYYRQNEAGITKTSVGKPKSIDTFYVLRSVMNARKELNLHTDKAFYEHLLRLIILSYHRTKDQPEMVKKSMFSLFKKMLEEERADKAFVLQGDYKRLEQTILKGDYRRYCFLCSLP